MQVTKFVKQIGWKCSQGKEGMVPWGREGLLWVTASVNRLGGNRIREIIQGMFEIMSNLKWLDLRHKWFEHLDSDVFFNGVIKLIYIYIYIYIYIHRVSQEERTKLRESVPYVKLYRYNTKHLCPKLNGWDNCQIKLWTSFRSTNDSCQLVTLIYI